jgi:adenine-specific DNA-methyltransferase
MEKIDNGHPLSQSTDFMAQNIETLKTLFPTIVKEGKIDIKELQALLGEDVETEEEYYRFTWAGKSMARREANKPSTATLRPDKESSKDWDTTQNIFIEGDNLEVLKLLQKSYANKIKMIYIDPPYNTGKDFVYKDNYNDNLGNYLAITGQVDEEGKRINTNSESDGRYHSNWLNMMYPRLKLARNLLKDDGVIFISIDDNEANNLKKMCDEIFGEENFVSQVTWQSTQKNDPRLVAINHEYIFVYLKNIQSNEHIKKWRIKHPLVDEMLSEFEKLRLKHIKDDLLSKEWKELIKTKYPALKHYSNFDKRGPYFASDISDPQRNGPKHDFVIHPITKQLCKPPSGGYSPRETEMKRRLNNDEIHFGLDHNTVVCQKKYLATAEDRLNSVIYEDGRRATKQLEALIGTDIFEHPKSEIVIKRLIEFTTDKDSITLDFFAGSGTTAHAVIQQNAEDTGNRKFICVQLPEPTDEKSEAYKAGYKAISEITKERIRRAGEKIKSEMKDDLFSEQGKTLDIGFRAFKLDSSNIRAWDGNPDALEDNLFNAGSNIKENRTEEDVLYEILLKYGLDLTMPIEQKEIAGKQVFNIGMGALFICLGDNITTAIAEGIGKWKEELQPATSKVIFKDTGFTDVEKTNSMQILKRYGILEVNTI